MGKINPFWSLDKKRSQDATRDCYVRVDGLVLLWIKSTHRNKAMSMVEIPQDSAIGKNIEDGQLQFLLKSICGQSLTPEAFTEWCEKHRSEFLKKHGRSGFLGFPLTGGVAELSPGQVMEMLDKGVPPPPPAEAEGVTVQLVRHDRPEATKTQLTDLENTIRQIPGIYQTQAIDTANPGIIVLIDFHPDYLHWLYVLTRSLDHRYGGFGFTLNVESHDVPPNHVHFLLREHFTAFGREAAIDNLKKNIQSALAWPSMLSHFGLDLKNPKKKPDKDPDGNVVAPLPDWTAPIQTSTKKKK